MKLGLKYEERYDNLLNEAYPEINLGVKFSPSDVLKEMDEIAYKEGYWDFLDAEGLTEDEESEE